MSKPSWMMGPFRACEMSSCSTIDLTEIRRSSKIRSWIWSIIRGGHCFGSSKTRRITDGKITTFKLGRPVFDGGVRWCMFLSELREFSSTPCLAGKKTCWQLVSRCCWNRARRLTWFLSASVTRKDLQFDTWTDPSFQRHHRFRPTTSGSRSG